MALSSTERYNILANIVAQKGTRNVNLYAELAKAESSINMMNTMASMPPPVPVEPTMSQPTEQPQAGQGMMGKYDNF